jgi:hypothetical protein
MDRPAIPIGDTAELVRLARLDAFLRRPPGQLVLELRPPPAEADRWESRLNARYGACGCEFGALAAIGGTAVYAGALAVADGRWLAGAAAAWAGVGLFCALGVLGKVVGMMWAARGFRVEVRRFLAALPPGAARPRP